VFQNFYVAKYELALNFLEKAILPPYKGSTLRGSFGVAFRRICCLQRKKECADCLLRQKCPFIYIFNSSPPPDAKKLRRYDNIPRPFLILPPLDKKQEYLPGEKLAFQLTLIGEAINYLPYFILAFKEMGKSGLGKKVNGKRGTFQLIRVNALSFPDEKALRVYSLSDDLVHNVDAKIYHSLIMEKVQKMDKEKVKITFITPLRLRYERNYIRHPEFYHLIKALLGRLSSLSYFYCGEELKIDFKKLIQDAQEVKSVSCAYSWQDWWRYSSRQKVRMALGGIVGEGRWKYANY